MLTSLLRPTQHIKRPSKILQWNAQVRNLQKVHSAVKVSVKLSAYIKHLKEGRVLLDMVGLCVVVVC